MVEVVAVVVVVGAEERLPCMHLAGEAGVEVMVGSAG